VKYAVMIVAKETLYIMVLLKKLLFVIPLRIELGMLNKMQKTGFRF